MIQGRHVLALVGLLLCAVAMRATEYYAQRYQSLPVLDWLESRQPFTDSASVPTAAELARGLSRTMPLLVIRDDARPWAPVFGPPAVVQRSMGGVRDSASIVLASPGTYTSNQVPVQVRLYAVVFNRTLRAEEWTQLMAREMDARDPDSGLFQSRITGPDETDGVWIVAPRQTGGIVTVVGHRGPVGFDLQLTFGPRPEVYAPPAELELRKVELSARAEVAARRAAADWARWVQGQGVGAS